MNCHGMAAVRRGAEGVDGWLVQGLQVGISRNNLGSADHECLQAGTTSRELCGGGGILYSLSQETVTWVGWRRTCSCPSQRRAAVTAAPFATTDASITAADAATTPTASDITTIDSTSF